MHLRLLISVYVFHGAEATLGLGVLVHNQVMDGKDAGAALGGALRATLCSAGHATECRLACGVSVRSALRLAWTATGVVRLGSLQAGASSIT